MQVLRVVLQVGGFTWSGHFTWVVIPEAELARRGSPVAPTRYVASVWHYISRKLNRQAVLCVTLLQIPNHGRRPFCH
jgi:hypothetical protein